MERKNNKNFLNDFLRDEKGEYDSSNIDNDDNNIKDKTSVISYSGKNNNENKPKKNNNNIHLVQHLYPENINNENKSKAKEVTEKKVNSNQNKTKPYEIPRKTKPLNCDLNNFHTDKQNIEGKFINIINIKILKINFFR